MKSLDTYPALTIRISKVRIDNAKHTGDDGHGYRHLVNCDEIPECKVRGSTASEAPESFRGICELWSKLSR